MIEFRLPSLGADMDQGKLLEWLVKPGDAVKKGQILCIVDTAKAAIDVECWHDGIVHTLLLQPGITIPVGTPMAVLREPDDTDDAIERTVARLQQALRAPTVAKPAAVAAPAVAPAVAPAIVPAAPAVAARRISPAARKRAAELGLDLDTIAPGPDGTVSLADVERAAAKPAAPAAAPAAARAAEMRKVIAAAMARSKREIPHYYLSEDVPLAAATAWLDAQNATRGLTERLLLAPLLLKAVAAALVRYPEFNGYWRDDAFAPGAGIHIGVAISLRAGGLVTPALHDVDRKDIDQVNAELLDLTRRTRAGSLKLAELTEGTITVTSLGDQGVASVLGVIYPPQVALVGFGRVLARPWVVDGEVRALSVVTASLAADHRASDGHRGGLLLAAVRDLLQAPDELVKGIR